ncbi:hypothetical protein ACFLYK_02250 [Candidatus Cloacimonadota bacterium]
MEDGGKSINNLKLSNRITELNNINLLQKEFGDTAFRAVENYYFNSGFQIGFDRLVKLVKEKLLTFEMLKNKPLDSVRDFLHGYFIDRGGNLPDVWHENGIVFLKTEYCKYCVTIEAEESAEKSHNDVCAIYCRSFAKGLVKVLEDFYPGLVINFYNVSSRRDGKDSDCVEAFQVITPN